MEALFMFGLVSAIAIVGDPYPDRNLPRARFVRHRLVLEIQRGGTHQAI